MTFLIILAVILIIAIIVFAIWFAAMKADGKCPICALKHLGSSKLTIDIENEDDYDNGVSPSPLMGWSSWNTLRNHIDEDTIIETAKAMKETLGCEGLNIVQNNGEIAGQTVFHFHMHIIPRYKGDTVNIGWTPGKADADEINELKEKIAAGL